MYRSTGGSLVSPASVVELLRKVDRAAYPAKSILVSRQSSSDGKESMYAHQLLHC
jgi:hypothetical protein